MSKDASTTDYTPEGDNMQGADGHTLAAVVRRLDRIERMLTEERQRAGRWLTPAQAARCLNVSIDVVRDRIKKAVEAGEDVIFGHMRIQQVGRGVLKQRYRVFEPDILRPPVG